MQVSNTQNGKPVRKVQRLPKIVINKKNFVFRDAIEQIRRDRKKDRSNSRLKYMRQNRRREVLSEEAREPINQFNNDDVMSNYEIDPFIIAQKTQAKKKIKLYAKKLKKRTSDPIRLDIEAPEHQQLNNFTKFNKRCLSNLK